MKKSLFIGMIFTLFFSCNRPQTSYNIQGKVNRSVLNNKTVYLYQQNKNGGYDLIDSARIENNIFTFSGSQDSSQLGICLFDRRENVPFRPLTFVLENGTIKIVLDTIPTVNGTELNNRLQTYFGKINRIEQHLNRLHDRYAQLSSDTATDQNLLNDIQKQGQKLIEESKYETETFIGNNLDNVAGAYVFSIAALNLDEDKVKAYLDSAGNAFKSNPAIRPIVRKLENKERVRIGRPFVDLQMKNSKGEQAKLSDWAGRGKAVVVDFWASWCPPCREEMPALIELYKKYRDRVDFVGVSLDASSDSWISAIGTLNIPWGQLSDLKGWQSQAVDLYGIESIPYLLLLDEEGRIVAKGLNAETLKEKLAERYPEPTAVLEQ